MHQGVEDQVQTRTHLSGSSSLEEARNPRAQNQVQLEQILGVHMSARTKTNQHAHNQAPAMLLLDEPYFVAKEAG